MNAHCVHTMHTRGLYWILDFLYIYLRLCDWKHCTNFVEQHFSPERCSLPTIVAYVFSYILCIHVHADEFFFIDRLPLETMPLLSYT